VTKLAQDGHLCSLSTKLQSVLTDQSGQSVSREVETTASTHTFTQNLNGNKHTPSKERSQRSKLINQENHGSLMTTSSNTNRVQHSQLLAKDIVFLTSSLPATKFYMVSTLTLAKFGNMMLHKQPSSNS